MKTPIIIFIATLAGVTVLAQPARIIDSLNVAYQKATSDTVKANAIHALFEAYLYSDGVKARQLAREQLALTSQIHQAKFRVTAMCDFAQLLRVKGSFDSSIVEYNAALKVAEEVGFNKEISRALNELGINYYYLGNYEKAKQYFEQNLEFCTRTNSQTGISAAYNSLGNVDYALGNFAGALEWYTQAARKNLELGDERRFAIAHSNVGRIEMQLENYESALTYFKSAKKIYDKLQVGTLTFTLRDLGIIYKKMGLYDSSLHYYGEALVRYEKMGEKREISEIHHNLGSLYVAKNDLDRAENEFLKALAISVEIQDSSSMSDQYVALGTIYHDKKQNIRAKQSLLKASDLALRFKSPLNLIKSEELLASLYEMEGDYRNAYLREHSARVLRDSLYKTEKSELAKEIETKYQTEQKEQEIELLQAENELKTQQVKSQERERYYLISLAGIILILVAVLYNRYTIKNKAHQRLKELDTAKSRFFANISHEFRTPLTLIAGCLEDLNHSGVENEEDRMRITVMQKNTRRLHQLIEQLLDLSKLDAGKLQLHVAPTNLAAFLNAITSSFSSWAVQKNISLEIDLPQESVQGYLDEDVVEKIIDNLLSNAIKFTPQGGKVSLSATWQSGELMITIADSGPGIPASKLGRIFERFYQGDDSATRRQEGSGIGLALVRELVSLHKGKINVRSQPEEGTVFTVIIPLHEKYYASSEIGLKHDDKEKLAPGTFESSPQAGLYAESPEPVSDNPIILVVEDNIDLGNYIGEHLPEHAILLAGNGVEGFNKAVQHVPDLIISDVMMPEMDGVQLCRKVKKDERTSHIPLILLTAKADIESRLEGLETGADDYMTKPFNARELQTRVRNLITQREKLKERFSQIVVLKPKDIALTSPDEVFLEKVMSVIEVHLGDSEFSQDDFQKEVGMSRMQLHRKLKALTGHSPGEFMRIQRLIRASDMLRVTSNISDVCYQTGFTSLSYFARCFRKQFGTTPKEYSLKHSAL